MAVERIGRATLGGFGKVALGHVGQAAVRRPRRKRASVALTEVVLMANETVGQLQSNVLTAVLEGGPLPGSTQPFAFPDLSFVRDQQTVVVADDNLEEPERVEELPFSVEVLPVSEIQVRARREGNVAYLRFEPVEREGDTVWLTLKAEIAPREPQEGILGLSGARMGFRKRTQDGWELVAGPTTFAA